jgi:hypothetical protein
VIIWKALSLKLPPASAVRMMWSLMTRLKIVVSLYYFTDLTSATREAMQYFLLYQSRFKQVGSTMSRPRLGIEGVEVVVVSKRNNRLCMPAWHNVCASPKNTEVNVQIARQWLRTKLKCGSNLQGILAGKRHITGVFFHTEAVVSECYQSGLFLRITLLGSIMRACFWDVKTRFGQKSGFLAKLIAFQFVQPVTQKPISVTISPTAMYII